MDELTLQEVIHRLCHRPAVYIGSTSFKDLSFFLDGFAWGRGGEAREQWSAFRIWLAERAYRLYGAPQNTGCYEYVTLISARSSQDSFAQLEILFDEFLLEIHSSEPSTM
jgi:hypothetical protein